MACGGGQETQVGALSYHRALLLPTVSMTCVNVQPGPGAAMHLRRRAGLHGS